MVPACCVSWAAIDVARDDVLEIRNGAAAILEHARVDFQAAPAAGLDEFGEKIAIGVLERGVHALVAQGCVFVKVVVGFDPDEREFAAGVIGQGHAVVGSVAERLEEHVVVTMAVGHDGVDRRGFLNQVQRALDAFIEHSMRPHLDADKWRSLICGLRFWLVCCPGFFRCAKPGKGGPRCRRGNRNALNEIPSV